MLAPALEKNRSRLKMAWRRLRRPGAVVLIVASAAVVILFIVGSVLGRAVLNASEPAYGATFSRPYAQFLGLDWRAAYIASLDDLGLRRLRLPAYWEDIEPTPGQYDFSDLDWQVAEASKRGVSVIISVGIKQPRWPECHLPSWAAGRGETEIQRRALTMIAAVVEHYRFEKAISVWQVENEPLLPFGVCPKPDPEFLRSEVAEVRALDRRPVLIQDAGEFSTWFKTARDADILGVSLYRED